MEQRFLGTSRVRVGSSRFGGEGLFSAVQFLPGDVVCGLDVGHRSGSPDKYSIQVSRTEHVSPGLGRWLNHSCEPNVYVDCARLEIAALCRIEAGEELYYFYPSTEWAMAEPFDCRCGRPSCLGRIRGAKHLVNGIERSVGWASHVTEMRSMLTSAAGAGIP